MVYLRIHGLTCAHCARHVTEAIQSIRGIESLEIDVPQATARWRWADGVSPALGQVIQAIQQAGFDAEPVEAVNWTKRISWSPFRGWLFNVVLGLAVFLPLGVGAWFFKLEETVWFGWVSFALASVVQVFGGVRFYRGAWGQLKSGGANMDTLVALGSTTAYGYSAWTLLSQGEGHLFFLEAVAIITLISIGHWLEAGATERAASAIRSLLDLAPVQARRLQPDGTEMVVEVSALTKGDRLGLRPGDRVPVDGIIREGRSCVDESMLTGESRPVDKEPGSPVYAGTINTNSRLVMEATAMGTETVLAQIVAAVQRCQGGRAAIQRLGDRVSAVFVPLVILIAIATGMWWTFAPDLAEDIAANLEAWLWPAHIPSDPISAAVLFAAGVLIVACPCAMGLATPVALMVGAQVGARRGILIRDGIALEKTGQLTAVVFDKTGTLTQGKLCVTAFLDLRSQPIGPGRDLGGELTAPATDLVVLAASLARSSNHPVSQAVARLSDRVFPLAQWKEHQGSGLSAEVQGATPDWPAGTVFRLGSLRWLRESQVDLTAAKPFVDEWSPRGATLVGLSVSQQLVGILACQDQVKPHAQTVIQQLRDQGKRVYLVSGDSKPTVTTLGHQLGFAPDDIYAEMRPEHKASLIHDLQQTGKRVAFVGDGINDAPALEQADLGIAVSRASDIARESADLVLLNSDVQAIPEALALAQRTLKTIKQNLFWAFFYNAAAIPLAALGFLSPILCAAAMGLSDLIVIGNSLSLRRWQYRE